jgi:LCP family protein required for cell wall assembly
MLLMGIDELGPVKASDSHKNTGEADMVALVIFDETNRQIDILCLNRDTMVEMPVLGIGGKNAGTFYGQLALSHAYGTGLEDSCENTKKAVSDFLYGLDISHYVAMNLDAISILNDAVGGVTVNVTDDFSDVDPTIQLGEMTLMGQQAIHYVQVRKDIGDQKNVSRMQRQQDYMEGFLKSFRRANSEESFVIETYDRVSDYIVTDFTAKSMSATLNQYSDYTLDEVVTPEGEHKIKGQHNAFYADEQKLDELILRMFYAPKK